MKKKIMLSLSIAALFAVVTGCSPKEKQEKNSVEINVSADKTSLRPDETTKLWVRLESETAPSDDVTYTFTSDNEDVANVGASSLTLAKGESEISTIITAYKAGTAKISFSTSADISKVLSGTITITVTESPAGTPVISIAADGTFLSVDETAKISISSTIAATEDITLEFEVGDGSVASLSATTFTLVAGVTTLAGPVVTALAEGETTVSFTVTAGTADRGTSSVTIEVGDIPVGSENVYLYGNHTLANGSPNTSWQSFGYGTDEGDIYQAGIFGHYRTWKSSTVDSVYKMTLEPYGGDFVGELNNGYYVLTPVPKGTKIDNNLAWTGEGGGYPALWMDGKYSVGENVYVVLTMREGHESFKGPFRRAWLKVSASASGDITVHEGAICLDDDAVFKVGQK